MGGAWHLGPAQPAPLKSTCSTPRVEVQRGWFERLQIVPRRPGRFPSSHPLTTSVAPVGHSQQGRLLPGWRGVDPRMAAIPIASTSRGESVGEHQLQREYPVLYYGTRHNEGERGGASGWGIQKLLRFTLPELRQDSSLSGTGHALSPVLHPLNSLQLP